VAKEVGAKMAKKVVTKKVASKKVASKKRVANEATIKEPVSKKAAVKTTTTKKAVRVTRARRRTYEMLVEDEALRPEKPASELSEQAAPRPGNITLAPNHEAQSSGDSVATSAVTQEGDSSDVICAATDGVDDLVPEDGDAPTRASGESKVENDAPQARSDRSTGPKAPVPTNLVIIERASPERNEQQRVRPEARKYGTYRAVSVEEEDEILRERVDGIIKGHTIVAMGIGAIPAPLIDAVAIAVLQLRMVRRLATAYSVSYEPAPTWAVTTVTGVLSLPGGLFASMVKGIPVLGTWLGSATAPLIAGASTYAVGQVFGQHFRMGGTFLTLDPIKARKDYKVALEQGRKSVKRIAVDARAKRVDAEVQTP
jgi:uncharacterized protein (DUF697 family)